MESEIGDFAEILKTGDKMEAPVIVGGHAVGLWGRYYLSMGMTYTPLQSPSLNPNSW